MNKNTYKLVLKEKVFIIPSDFRLVTEICPEIYHALISKGQYKVKSNVNEQIFEKFINILLNQVLPEFHPENFFQYDILFNEFGIMTNVSKIFRKKFLHSFIYLIWIQNQELKETISKQILKKEENTSKYNQIIRALFTNQALCKQHKLKYLKSELLHACKTSDTNLISLLFTQKEVKENKIQYLLNEAEKTATVLRCFDQSTDIIIPKNIIHESIKFSVKCLAEKSFSRLNNINSIRFENESELKFICKESFSYSMIKSILIPSHVTRIGECAFSSCYNLKTVQFADKSELETIEKFAFSNSSIESITIPSSVKELKEGWCDGIINLKYIKVSTNQNQIQNISYFNDQFIIGKTNIANEKFDVLLFCRRDTKTATIPSFIIKIDSFAFDKSIELQKVEFPDDSELQTIGDSAFSRTFIEDISIPSHVTHIGNNCFSSCRMLKNIFFKNDSELRYIGNAAFSLTFLEKIIIPSHVTRIGEYTFSCCYNLKTVEFAEKSELETIEKEAFTNSMVESITIPSSVKELKEGWCNSVSNLKNIRINRNQNQNILYFNDQFIIGKTNITNEEYDVLIFSRRDIKTAIIPSFIKRIAPFAFEGCQKLKKVQFSEHSQLESIGKFAFANSRLASITIPFNTKYIEGRAFFGCRRLKRVEFEEGSKLVLIDNYAFANTSIESIHIPRHVRQIKDFCFSCCARFRHIEFPDDSELKFIGKAAFYSTSLECIKIPIHVNEIGQLAFSYCGQMKAIEIHERSKLTCNLFSCGNVMVPVDVVNSFI